MTASFSIDITPQVLMSVWDALRETFKGKQYECEVQPLAPVPENVLQLWRDRGYDPSATGIAVVTFFNEGKATKPYSYPAYFWSEV